MSNLVYIILVAIGFLVGVIFGGTFSIRKPKRSKLRMSDDRILPTEASDSIELPPEIYQPKTRAPRSADDFAMLKDSKSKKVSRET